ncbi:hypothetical protein V8G54_020654, partial [Vigna mungo]
FVCLRNRGKQAINKLKWIIIIDTSIENGRNLYEKLIYFVVHNYMNYLIYLDMEEDAKVPIILGRPFLATGRALIDVEQGELMLRVADEKVTFSINEAVKHKLDKEDCFRAEIIESLVLE